jgi:AcrR family transcriptional regulator
VPYRPTARTEAQRIATRERIVSAARDQVAEGGYASASVQAVAKRAGVATGSVYRHFDSKAELFVEVFRRSSQPELDLVTEITADGSRPASERIAATAEAFARRALASPVLAYALIAEPVDPLVEAERLAFRRGYRDAIARALEDGMAAGELRELDSQVVAAAMVGALAESLVGPLSPGAARAPDALVANLVQFCFSAIIHSKEKPRVGARSDA